MLLIIHIECLQKFTVDQQATRNCQYRQSDKNHRKLSFNGMLHILLRLPLYFTISAIYFIISNVDSTNKRHIGYYEISFIKSSKSSCFSVPDMIQFFHYLRKEEPIMTNSEKLDLLLKGMQEINTRLSSIEDRLAALEERVTIIENRLSALEERVAIIENRLSVVEDRLSALEERVAIVEDRLSALEERVAIIENRLSAVEQDVRQIKLVAENELRVNIKRIAEGHLDLSRNLHEAIKPCAEMEMLTVRVGILESDVRNIKKKMA